MSTLAQDLRHGMRTLARSPGFTAAAMVSLAIGIGANTAIFSVTNALRLRPLPYRDADRLAILWNRSPGLGIAEDWFSTAQYFDIKTATAALSNWLSPSAATPTSPAMANRERVGTIRVSSNLLPMLDARAAGPAPRGRAVGRHQRAATYPDLRLDADSHRRPDASRRREVHQRR